MVRKRTPGRAPGSYRVYDLEPPSGRHSSPGPGPDWWELFVCSNKVSCLPSPLFSVAFAYGNSPHVLLWYSHFPNGSLFIFPKSVCDLLFSTSVTFIFFVTCYPLSFVFPSSAFHGHLILHLFRRTNLAVPLDNPPHPKSPVAGIFPRGQLIDHKAYMYAALEDDTISQTDWATLHSHSHKMSILVASQPHQHLVVWCRFKS